MKILNKLRLKNNFTQMRDGYFAAFIATSFLFSTLVHGKNDFKWYEHSFKESTNLRTANYIWEFEVMPDPQVENELRIRLINPHPQLKVLNQRALEIVQQSTRQEIESKLSAFNQSLKETPNKDDRPSSIDRLYHKVRFVHGVAYTYRQPQFLNIKHIMVKVCRQLETVDHEGDSKHPYLDIPKFYNTKENAFHLAVRMEVAENGRITHYITLPKLEHKELVAALTRDIRGIRFNAYNENGVPTAFRVQQPINIRCS